MKAINFIKKYHKEYLNKDKIYNDVYDEEEHNYKYYYNKYCLVNFLENNKDTNSDYYLHFYKKNIPYNDDILILPIYFNKYNSISMIYNNIKIDNNFKNINNVFCNSLILNCDSILQIFFTEKLIINNKNNIEQININSPKYNNIESIIVINYLLLNKVELFTNNNYNNYKIINNTDEDVIFYYRIAYLYHNFQINNSFILDKNINYGNSIEYSDNKFHIYKEKNNKIINLIIKPHSVITFKII